MPEVLVLSGGEIATTIARFQSNIKQSWCACADSSIPQFSMSDPIKKGYFEAKERGVKIRYVTEITLGNVKHCKELMEFAELRHLDGVQGSFAVSERELVVGIRGNDALEKLLYADLYELVAHQQNIFETLWKVAIPAQERIRQLS